MKLQICIQHSLLFFEFQLYLMTLFCQADGPVKRGQIRDLLVPELRVTSVLLWFIWSVSLALFMLFLILPTYCIKFVLLIC